MLLTDLSKLSASQSKVVLFGEALVIKLPNAGFIIFYRLTSKSLEISTMEKGCQMDIKTIMPIKFELVETAPLFHELLNLRATVGLPSIGVELADVQALFWVLFD